MYTLMIEFVRPFFLFYVCQTALPRSGGLSPGQGWHACKKGVATELVATPSMCVAKRCMFDNCMCIIGHDMTTVL